MYAEDFEYDGQHLSDYGFTICEFDSSSGAVVSDAGSKISFERMSRSHGRRSSLVSADYDEYITGTIDICKKSSDCDSDPVPITSDESRDLMRWLNRREFLPFMFVSEELFRIPCYFNASFNVEKIRIDGTLYGMRLTMETDRPFGYAPQVDTTWNITTAGTTEVFADRSDEIGESRPDLKITCNAAGTLTLSNELTGSVMQIKNVSNGEIITIKGEEQMIESSLASHTSLPNDFNYEFLTIGNTFEDRKNPITVSIPCTIVISYHPTVKDSL